MEWVARFLAGGLIISFFSSLGDVLKPRGFAGLFGAAPSVALASLSLTIAMKGVPFAEAEARSMIFGAAAFVAYSIACVYLLAVRRLTARYATLGALSVWGVVAGLAGIFLR